MNAPGALPLESVVLVSEAPLASAPNTSSTAAAGTANYPYLQDPFSAFGGGGAGARSSKHRSRSRAGMDEPQGKKDMQLSQVGNPSLGANQGLVRKLSGPPSAWASERGASVWKQGPGSQPGETEVGLSSVASVDPNASGSAIRVSSLVSVGVGTDDTSAGDTRIPIGVDAPPLGAPPTMLPLPTRAESQQTHGTDPNGNIPPAVTSMQGVPPHAIPYIQ